MPSTRDREPALLASLLGHTGNPLDWSGADKCLLVVALVVPFLAWYLLWLYYFLAHPDVAPYVDREFLRLAFWPLAAGLMSGWLLLAAAGLWLRRHDPENRVLIHATAQLYGAGFGLFSYLIGPYTNGFSYAAGLGGATISLILFGELPVALAAVTFMVVILGTAVAEQGGWIPYAPLLVTSPYDGGRLSGWWMASFGSVTTLVALSALVVIFYVVRRWRDREVKLAQTSDQLARANDLISRYVAAQVADQIRAGNYDVVDRHDRRKLTLFFSDIKGFTEIADQMEAEDLSRVLNEYLAEMTAIAERYGATIDKFIGDAIMIFFGAPTATDDHDHALRATRMAIDMQDRMLVLREKWLREGIEEPFQIRIGINTGVASVGNFGAKGRLDYTAIGRQVNLAARLQVNCEPGKVLLSHPTFVLVRDEIPCIPRGEIQMKGIRAPVKVYEVAAHSTRERSIMLDR